MTVAASSSTAMLRPVANRRMDSRKRKLTKIYRDKNMRKVDVAFAHWGLNSSEMLNSRHDGNYDYDAAPAAAACCGSVSTWPSGLTLAWPADPAGLSRLDSHS